ncbi:hypothetical protein Pfo_007820 [Paulownia fortunei]|nr:hypothetical protein Pfo_007820 [Paulownia fortunei]
MSKFWLVLLIKNQPSFISLDCGLRGSNGYNDSITGLYYSTDGAYVETGEGRSISPVFRTNSLPPQFLNLRIFPGPEGTRNCYTLRPLYGKGNKILLKVGFMYGNYDDQSKVPQFDLYLGVDYWETVTFGDSSSVFATEILHIPTSDYLHVCLVNTGLGTPFISVLELRPMDPLRPVYNTTSGSLKSFARWDLGSTSNNFLRYKDGDPYDRMWGPVNQANTTILSTTATSFAQNWFNPPPIVMKTAAQAPTTNDSITILFIPNNSSDQVYVYLHFAELVANQSREMTIFLNGLRWYGPFVPPYLGVFSVFSRGAATSPNYVFQISATSNSKLPPILNAIEIYTVKQFPHYETDENDVAALTSIKATYAITKNWQGDPCSPKNFAWIGINCSYNGFEPPEIISLNLSSSGLIGTIALSISNLTRLQSLDLSYNNLTGEVYLEGNNFTGSLPPALLEKRKNGSLILSLEIPTNHTNPCTNDACKKKKNTTIVLIVASVAAFFATITLSTLICMIIRRKRQGMENNAGSSIEPKLRRFTFSEVMGFIGERRILGGGGFGTVYHGCIDGVEVAVKVLNVKILAKVHHKNLIGILGYCDEGINRAIIFELMENGNLKDHLSDRNPNVLSWELRLAVITGAAEGLEYLHHGCKPPIIHRDIKPENILLTKEFEAKLADFGLSRIFPVQTSRVMGTFGYHDPEYRDPGMVTEKIDVYSFGVVMLVVVTGQPAIIQGTTNITQWIGPKIINGDIRGIVDPRLEGNYDVNVAWRVVELAMACVSRNPSSRPNMHYVVKELKECLPTAVAQHEGGDERRDSNDGAGIRVVPSNMRSVFRPSTSKAAAATVSTLTLLQMADFAAMPERLKYRKAKIHQVLAQSPPGFISLDCGLRGSNGYNDSITGLYYSTDGAYVETGEGRSISPVFGTNSLPPQFLNLRIFPGPEGTRNCYNLRPLYGKGNKILLRVAFMYGNYDDQNKVPKFDLYLGVNYWETVTFTDSSSVFVTEILHIPTSDYLYVCLVNTGLGTPFISVLELRPMDPLKPVYNTTSGSLKVFERLDLGSTTSPELVQPAAHHHENCGTSANTNDSIIVPFVPNNPSDQVYIYLHFAELVASQSREMTIFLNGFHWYGPFVPPYLGVYSVFSKGANSYPNYEIKVNVTSNSTLPPILNAIEIYTVKQFPHSETDVNDVAAIISVKATYAITKNWQGDPCSPQNFVWTGINCSYNGFEPPKIISLNLSSSGLTGAIAPSISNLTSIQSLDLSYNNLTGQVPEFLCWLHSLRYLYLGGNNFNGSLPPALLEKSRNGSLILSLEIPTNHTNPCPNDACKRKKNTIIAPIVASLAAFSATIALSTLICMIIRRKRQAVQSIRVESNGNNAGSSIEPKLRRFTFSEVMGFIGERRILGGGGFGTVYHGCIDGFEVAVKVLNVSPQQETKDFQAEVKILAKVHHKNLIGILGYCDEGINRAIIFELMENGNLKDHLSERNPNVLSWELRLAIMIGVAEGLEYLHHDCRPPIIHRDIKPENILLTNEFEAKLADFGLSRIFPVQTSRVVGTHGYLDPEYRDPGMVTEKIDVYSFGVVMLVVVTGQPAIIQGTTNITQWIGPKIINGDIRGIIDPRLEGNYDVNVAWRVVELAMACVSRNPSSRPNMNYVVKELKECLPTAVAQNEGGDERRDSNDGAGIRVVPSNMRSVFRPSTR